MQGRRLGEDDLVRLGGALGEIGGDEACRLLDATYEASVELEMDVRNTRRRQDA